MEVSTVTGATPRNYIELRAQTTTECAALLECFQSKFLGCDCLEIVPGYVKDGRTIYMRVYVGQINQRAIDETMRAELDRLP